MDPRAFADLVAALQLEEIVLLDTSCSRVERIVLDEGVRVEPEVAHEASGGMEHDEDGRGVRCRVALSFTGRSAGAEIISVRATYAARYGFRTPCEPTAEVIDFFAKNNALFNVWPFFREHVVGLTTKMGFPAYTLPLLHPRRSD